MSLIFALDPGTTQTGYVLGVLCRRRHDHDGTGKSLRYRSGSCVACQTENAKARRAVDGEQMNAKSAEWHRAHPQNGRAAVRRYYSANREKLAAKQSIRRKANRPLEARRQREYRQRNLEAFRAKDRLRVRSEAYRQKFNAYRRQWRAVNGDKAREHAHKRAGAKVGRLPRGTVQRLGQLQRWKCAACRSDLRKTGYHRDHIVPLVRGGAHEPSNIQLLCPPCNLSKGAKHPVDFMRQRGALL